MMTDKMESTAASDQLDQDQPQGNSSESATGNSQNTSQSNNRGPPYGESGIITERPQMSDYAMTSTRLTSFEHWPRDHPCKKEDLVAAGFYYAGHEDSVCCFHCGGALKNWKADENVWVEHARRFPKCAFLRQTMGQLFVDSVQDLNKICEKITSQMATDKIESTAASVQLVCIQLDRKCRQENPASVEAEVQALIFVNSLDGDAVIYTDGSVVRCVRSSWTFTAQAGGRIVKEDSGAFVETTSSLIIEVMTITYQMVTDKMGSTKASVQLDTRNMPLKRDPAVLTVLEMGYSEADVIEAANYVKENCAVLSLDKLLEKLEKNGKSRVNDGALAPSSFKNSKHTSDPPKDERIMNKLKEENDLLRGLTVCKICMDKEVAVLFLPCGHLISCEDCAAAMKDCPVCRKQVRGIVRAFMG